MGHPGGKKKIEIRSKSKKRIERLVLLDGEGADIIRQKAMKANMTDAQLRLTPLQLSLPICPQRQGRAPAADRVFPRMGEGDGLIRQSAKKSGMRFVLPSHRSSEESNA